MRQTRQFARNRLCRIILIGALAWLTVPAQAQLEYTYQGHRMSGRLTDDDPFHGQAVTAKLITDEIIPADPTSPPDYRTAQPCPKTWKFTIVVGTTLYESQNAYRSSCYYLGNTENGLLPAFLSLEIQQGNEHGGAAVRICSHIHHRTYDYLGCTHSSGVRWIPNRDPNLDLAGPYGEGNRTGFVGTASAQPGKWSPPKAADLAATLLKRLNAMKIQEPGTSLTAQITSVLSDVNNGALELACRDLEAFTDHVQAQTGNAIVRTEAATVLKWVEAIFASIPCTPK